MRIDSNCPIIFPCINNSFYVVHDTGEVCNSIHEENNPEEGKI